IERMSISEMQFEEIQRFGQDYESDKVMFDVLASLRSLEGEPQQDQKDSVEALKKAFRSAISSLVEVFKSTRPSATMQIQDEEAIKSEGGDSALIQALYQQGCGYLVDCFAMSFIRAGIQKSVVWSEAYAKYFQEMFDQLLSDDPKNIKTQIRAHFTTARKFNSEFRTEEYAGGELAFKLVLHGINNPGDERKCLEVLTVLFEFASSWKHKEWVGHLKECAIFLLVLGGDVDSEFGLPKIPSLYNDLKWPKVLINSLLNEVPRSKEVNFFLGLLKQAALPYLSSDQIQTQIAHFHDLGSKHYVNSYPVSRECEERLHRFARRHTELLNNNEGLNNFPHPTRSFELTLSNAAFLAEYVELLLYPQEKQAFSQRPLGHFYMPFLQTRSSFEEVMKDLVELFRWAGNAGDFKESALRALNLFLNHIEGQIKEVFGLSLENGKTLIEELLVICTHSKFGFDLMPGFLRELNRPKYEDQLYLVVYRFGLFLLNTYETAKKVFAEFIQVLAEIRQPKALLTTLIDILLTESDALSKMYRLFSSNEARGFPLNDASKNSIVALFKKHLKPGDWAECLEVFIKTLHVVELNFKEKKAWALALLQVEHGVPFSAVPDDFKDSIFFQVGVHEGRIAWKDVPDQIRQRIKVALLNSPMSSGKENRVVSIGGHGKNPQFFVMNKHGKIKGPISMVKHEEIKGPEKMRESPPRRDAHSPVQSKKISGVAAFDLSVEALRSLENPVSLPSPDPEAVKDAVEKLKARGLIMEDPLFYPSLDEPCPAPGFLSGVSMPFAGACLTHPASPQQGQQSLCVKKTQGSRSGQPKKPWARNKCMPIKPRGDLFLFKNIKFDALAEGELPENFDFSASPT
ncbi:MAG: hypothetical protein EBX40_01885, partial [Gammaproteobacteria bacterium]|nr:hypothetical protein [Gammaproteobacteria bacterium]